MHPEVSVKNTVTALYERKTDAIIERYGPGPKVHYHTGLADEPAPCGRIDALHAYLVETQERMLRDAANVWNIENVAFRDVLDVGCGLGGPAIFWAQSYGARVTAITIAPSHVPIVARFAEQAGLVSLIQPLLCDASAVPGEHCYDAAVALESAILFPRRPWFQRLAQVLRPGGHVFIFDCFLERLEFATPFNRYWCAQIGTLDEYYTAARDAGFRLETVEDVSKHAAPFWSATSALIRIEAQAKAISTAEAAKVEESARVHTLMRRGLLGGGLRELLLSFVKTA